MTEEAMKLLQVWETLANKVIAVCLTDQAAVSEIIAEVGSEKELFPGQQSDIWEAITGLFFDGDLPTVEAVAAKMGGEVEPGLIKLIQRQYTREDDENLIYNTKELFKLSQVAKIRKLGRMLSTVTQYDTMINKLGSTQREVDHVLTAKNARTRTTTELMAGIDHLIDRNGQGIKTGMSFFDKLAGGSWIGMNYWIGGAYKSGKSTLMRNIALTALLNEQPVEIYAAENGAEIVALQFIVMLAILQMRKRGITDLPKLSVKAVLQNYAMFNRSSMTAYQEAKVIFESLPLEIYDTSDGIRHLPVMRAKVKKAKNDRGVQLFLADHSLLFGAETKGNTYERAARVAETVQGLAVDEKISFWMCAQKNEESIKHGQKSYSPGLKGGGDAPAAADFVFIPKIDKDSPMLEVELKLSRWTELDNGSHLIHRGSGLIL